MALIHTGGMHRQSWARCAPPWHMANKSKGERASAMGLHDYLRGFRLTPEQMFDAQGNHVDYEAMIQRVGGFVIRWLRGEDLPN